MTRKKQTAAVEPLLYPIPETCARLGGISRTKLYAEIAAGKLETVKIGDRRFTTDAQQRTYIERQQRNGAD